MTTSAESDIPSDTLPGAARLLREPASVPSQQRPTQLGLAALPPQPLFTLTSSEVHLVARPRGIPTKDNFSLVQLEIAPLRPDEILVRNLVISVDPYMRGRMNDAKSYVPPFALDKALEGAAIGEVIESRCEAFPIGTMVSSNLGWREYAVATATELHPVDCDIYPVSTHLGALGMTGMTAWIGLRVLEAKAGDVVYISGAAGAVGNVAGQLAKKRGCRVIGSAGSAAKVKFLIDECGFDAAFNYRQGPILDQLSREAPDGIDIYFDNVGGEALEAALSTMRVHGRILECGGISGYNDVQPRTGPSNFHNVTTKRLTIIGMIVRDWVVHQVQFEKEMGGYLQDGTVKNKETVIKGLENAIEAFLGLFQGHNVGKMVVRLAPRG
jgi:NADPH-dependent curcumin reductase CurA